MTEPDVLVMVCSSCQNENTIIQNKKLRKVTSCSHCQSVLFEIDDVTDNYRITKNFRIYYRSLSDTLYDIQASLMQKSEEIRKQAASDKPTSLRLWSEAIRANQVFEPEILNILETTIGLLDNENILSDNDTKASAADFLSSSKDILSSIQKLSETDEELLEALAGLKNKTKGIHEFAKMFDMYLGELGSYERKLSR